ncbi:MAG TPA: Fic/DOC family N-terminal domain-containing protein, partial [Streptosporangiaceae bacterium]
MTNGRVALVGWADHVAQLDFFIKSPVLLGRVVLPGMQARAYCPDLLNGRHFTLEGDVAADVTEAETAITRLNSEALALADTEALARLLLRAESVASSRIEGLEIGARRLLRAEAARDLGERTGDAMAVEVLSNIDAMSAAISEVGPGDPISVATRSSSWCSGAGDWQHGYCRPSPWSWPPGPATTLTASPQPA